jgi:transcriptional regulator with XRE-family HTH domain
MRITENHLRAGDYLRRVRRQRGLTTRLVAQLSSTIAADRGSEEFSISHARLVQIENEASAPSIYKLFTLSAVYGLALTDLLAAYVDVDAPIALHGSMQHASTHVCSFDAVHSHRAVPIPMQVNSVTSLANTNLMSQIADVWGDIPAPALAQLKRGKYRYGFIGLTDQTMYPLIRPGSFVQIDECQKIAPKCEYRTEMDRPIYFIELRTGYICSWCEIVDGHLLSIPHPLSPTPARQFTFPSEAEVIGRVTGVAVRLAPAVARERQNKKADAERVAGVAVHRQAVAQAVAV